MRRCAESMPRVWVEVESGRMGNNLGVSLVHISYGMKCLRLTLLSQSAIEFGSQWNRTWKSGLSLVRNETRSVGKFVGGRR